MATINEVGGCYVSSSIPKVLMLPISTKHLRSNKKGTSIKHTRSSDALYSLAVSRDSGRYQNAPRSTKQENELGECPPVSGRQHIKVQTDLYLEELCDLVAESDQACQTDILLDRPASPLFVPAKIGVDVGTQIWTGDLFDFDEEVQPLLESLVNQTIEQSLIEIVASQELVSLKEQQKEHEIQRNVELADRIRLQDQERRLLEERQKRLKEQEEAVKLEEETAEKIAACVYAQNYLSDLLPKVYKRLESQGYFATQVPEIQQVEEDFWPWLMKEVDAEIATLEASYHLLDSLIGDAVQNVIHRAVIKPVTPDIYPRTEEQQPEEQDSENAEQQPEEQDLENEEQPTDSQAESTDLVEETEVDH